MDRFAYLLVSAFVRSVGWQAGRRVADRLSLRVLLLIVLFAIAIVMLGAHR